MQEFGKQRIGNYRRRKNGFSNENPSPSPPSCICICSWVSDQLCLDFDSFLFPRRASAVLGPVRFPQIASCLVFQPFLSWFILCLAMYREWLRVSASVETQLGVLLYHKASSEISKRGWWALLSLAACLWDPCPQVCGTGDIAGVRGVPGTAPAASAQYPVWDRQAHSSLLCPCFCQCWESEELECESKPLSVVLHLLRCFCYWKVFKTFKVYSVFFSVDAKRLRWLLGPKTVQYSFE